MENKKKAVFGIYETVGEAERVVDRLMQSGFSSDDISVLVPDNQSSRQFAHEKNTKAPEGTTTGQRAEPLGDKLARSDGVLCPPAGIDPEMRAPAPDGGRTPVIPPPGSPGGDPSIRPK